MSSSNNVANTHLRHAIFYHIDNDLLDTANFLAGRLHAADTKNPDSIHLLSLTYFRLRRYKAAYDFASKVGISGKHLGCAYVFAQACLQLGRHMEAITALERARALWAGKSHWSKHSDSCRRHLPDAPAVLTVLGKLWQAHGDMKKAADCFVEAHKANPLIWEAFEGLCKVGADLNVNNMFKPSPEHAPAKATIGNKPSIYLDKTVPSDWSLDIPQGGHVQLLDTPSDPFGPTRTRKEPLPGFFIPTDARSKRPHTNGPSGAVSEWDTPVTGKIGTDDESATGDMLNGSETESIDLLGAPPRKPQISHFLDSTDLSKPPSLRSHLYLQPDPIPADDKRPNGLGLKRTISGQTTRNNAPLANDATSAPRRSNRLYGQTSSTRMTRATNEISTSLNREERAARAHRTATGAKSRLGSTVGRVVSGNRKVLPPDPNEKEKERRAPSRTADRATVAPGVTSATLVKPAQPAPTIPTENDVDSEQLAYNALLENLRQLATGSYALARFDLTKAVQIFRSLPTHARDNPWMLAQLAKAHYEAVDYKAAEECFARVLRLQPSRTDDMEVYSTVLWHLKKESTLACLCHTLKDQDFQAPETWCAVGNAFSLARDHDQAIAAFRRATQISEGFAYAWTLMGHEYIANEEFEMALTSFRKSVAADRRGYGGWYGLGKSYERMGKLEEAERHYRIAAAINPSNATLLVCIGVVLERLQNRGAALTYYGKALDLAPTSALARFKKARVLMHLRYHSEALQELQELRDQAPDEANVWFLLGKCYKSLGEKGEALRALTTALNLDVKAAPFIKEAMEALDDDDYESESE